MNNEIVLYETVSVEKELPETGEGVVAIVDGCEMILNYRGKRKGWQDEVSECGSKERPTHWLRPLPSHVPISVERLEAYEKCVSIMKKVRSTLNWLDNDKEIDLIDQALTNLSTIKH